MTALRPIALAALALAVLSGCGATAYAPAPAAPAVRAQNASADLFPLGGSWTYEVTTAGATTVKTVSTENLVFVARNVNIERAELVTRVEGKETARQSVVKQKGSLTLEGYGFDIELAKLGKKGVVGQSKMHTASVLGTTRLSTPAGKFERVVKLEIASWDETETLYLAPGTGLVKRTVAAGNAKPHTVEVLVKHKQ